MSLNFSVSDVEDYANRTTSPYLGYNGKEQWHPVTNVLVWSSIPCGFDRITKKTVDEVWRRVSLWQGLQGALLSGARDGDLYLTREDIEMHVGLTTNASTKTATEFTATLMRELDRKASHSNPNKLSAMHVIGWKGQPAAVVDEVNAVS